MAIIKPKRSTVAAKVPLPGDLEIGEIAINLTDKKLYSKDGGGAIIELGGSVAAASITKETTSGATHTVSGWGTIVEVDNAAQAVEVTLPAATTSDIGKSVSIWVTQNPAVYNVILKAPDLDHNINGVTSQDTTVAAAYVNTTQSSYHRLLVECVAADDVYVAGSDVVYSITHFKGQFTKTTDLYPSTHLRLSSIPTNFLTDNADWWYAAKIEGTFPSTSNDYALFCSNDVSTGVRGDGAYLVTNGTTGFTQTLSSTQIPSAGQWIIYQYNSTANTFDAWINGTKVLSGSAEGNVPSTLVPKHILFGATEPTRSRFTEIVISGLTDPDFNGKRYRMLDNYGRWLSGSDTFYQLEAIDYVHYMYDAGGGLYYWIVNDYGTGSWLAMKTNNDPSAMTNGSSAVDNSSEVVTLYYEEVEPNYYVPWSGEATVDYQGSPDGDIKPCQSPVEVSVLTIGTGQLSDANAALFTSGMYDPAALTLAGTVTNQWSATNSNWSTDVGAINLSVVGADFTFAQTY